MVRYLTNAVVVLLVAGFVAGCGNVPTSSLVPTSTPEPDPGVLLQRAAEELLSLDTVAFTLDHVTGTTVLFPGLEMSRAAGVVEIPDNSRLQIDAEAALMNAFVEVNIVTLGERAYMTDFISGEWRSVPVESLPINLAGFGQTLADIIDSMDVPRWMETVELDGRGVDLVAGRVTSGDLAGLVPKAAEDFPVELELWLDRESGLLRQVRITGQVVSTDIPETVRLLRLSAFDAPVTIIPPN